MYFHDFDDFRRHDIMQWFHQEERFRASATNVRILTGIQVEKSGHCPLDPESTSGRGGYEHATTDCETKYPPALVGMTTNPTLRRHEFFGPGLTTSAPSETRRTRDGIAVGPFHGRTSLKVPRTQGWFSEPHRHCLSDGRFRRIHHPITAVS